MPMKLFLVYGEDEPRRDESPYKAYLIIAADEATAREYTPSGFKIHSVMVAKEYPEMNIPPARLAWVGGRFPLTGNREQV